ncbi:hypothetical protein [Streptomyces sp. BPTC-684]|uniref:hypothetical protein n=1 Tax=Streptomyces sp. BPTC-684 TaxID=3043734 RepID=UPI0024B1085E|nr:hypothetical protein [Streptomyces sp. BPTC-684]WHM36322.1 hypothetical protein QIY60_04830 [Streptomyces sp. BPTC-684]
MAAIPLDLLDRIRDLERQVRELSGRAQMRPAMDKITHGRVTIGEGGSLAVIGPNGRAALSTGQWADGTYGTYLGRDDGSAAWTVGGSGTDTANMVRMWTRGGSAVVMDDAYADAFLGRPALPVPWQPTAGATTNSTTGATSWYAATRVQCPVFWLGIETYCPANVGARVDVEAIVPGGTWENWQTWTVSGGTSGRWTSNELTRPMHRLKHFSHITWRIRQTVTSGQGQISTNVMGSYQRNTFSAAETPQAPPVALSKEAAPTTPGAPAGEPAELRPDTLHADAPRRAV